MKTTKSAYSTPKLTVHGNVETLTQSGAGHTSHGGGNGYGHCINAGNPGHQAPGEDDHCLSS
jgi:hypothetical protein